MKRMIANIKDSSTGVKVPGDLIVDGTITQNKYLFDQDLSSLFPSQSGVSIVYAHARESNGKLSIVVYVKTDSTASTYANNVSFDIPENVYNQLNPSVGSMLDIKAYTSVPTFESASASLGSSIVGNYYLRIFKSPSNKIILSLHLEGTPSSGYVVLNRFEFNFLLS